jgi:hypothetical protein
MGERVWKLIVTHIFNDTQAGFLNFLQEKAVEATQAGFNFATAFETVNNSNRYMLIYVDW